MNKKLQIAVIGSAGAEEYLSGGGASTVVADIAEEVGELLAKSGATVVTGGKGGIMEAAARGAKKFQGQTVGVISGKVRQTSNRYTDIEVLSGMVAVGFDELILVMMSDALIVVGGGAGTLQEMAIAYRNAKPIVAIGKSGGWAEKAANSYLDERETTKIEEVATPKEAVNLAIKLANKK